MTKQAGHLSQNAGLFEVCYSRVRQKGGAIHINLFLPLRSMMTSWAYDIVVDDFGALVYT